MKGNPPIECCTKQKAISSRVAEIRAGRALAEAALELCSCVWRRLAPARCHVGALGWFPRRRSRCWADVNQPRNSPGLHPLGAELQPLLGETQDIGNYHSSFQNYENKNLPRPLTRKERVLHFRRGLEGGDPRGRWRIQGQWERRDPKLNQCHQQARGCLNIWGGPEQLQGFQCPTQLD